MSIPTAAEAAASSFNNSEEFETISLLIQKAISNGEREVNYYDRITSKMREHLKDLDYEVFYYYCNCTYRYSCDCGDDKTKISW
jgi:hypothetical protein